LEIHRTLLLEQMPARVASRDGSFFLMRAKSNQETEQQLEDEVKGYRAHSHMPHERRCSFRARNTAAPQQGTPPPPPAAFFPSDATE
jgi:hypothetical protein